jgi:hypothetical protein
VNLYLCRTGKSVSLAKERKVEVEEKGGAWPNARHAITTRLGASTQQKNQTTQQKRYEKPDVAFKQATFICEQYATCSPPDTILREITCSHGGEYADDRLLESSVVPSDRN